MQVETYDVLWLDRSQRVSIDELVDLSGLTENEIHELVEFGALAPFNALTLAYVGRRQAGQTCVITHGHALAADAAHDQTL